MLSEISANNSVNLTAYSLAVATLPASQYAAGYAQRYTPEDLEVGTAVQNPNAGSVGKGR
jgi:hypothetical protein